ncbi:MAG: ribonuclease D, partial [Pseudomonadota bacterium]
MTPITTQSALEAACTSLKAGPFLTVDTEFMRDSTYWPKLCLVQVANPDAAFAIDPLADGLDLSPFYDLMNEASIPKVFHAARQDVEIFY